MTFTRTIDNETLELIETNPSVLAEYIACILSLNPVYKEEIPIVSQPIAAPFFSSLYPLVEAELSKVESENSLQARNERLENMLKSYL